MSLFSTGEKTFFIIAGLLQLLLIVVGFGFAWAVLFLLCLVFAAMYAYRMYIGRKCSKCGANGAVMSQGKTIVSERRLQKLKETDSTGRRVQPYYVFGKETTIRETFRCNNCGATTHKDSKKIDWDDDNL